MTSAVFQNIVDCKDKKLPYSSFFEMKEREDVKNFFEKVFSFVFSKEKQESEISVDLFGNKEIQDISGTVYYTPNFSISITRDKDYTIVGDDGAVISFIRVHNLNSGIQKTVDVLKRYFYNSSIKLELISDPDDASYSKLSFWVQTSLDPRKAFELLTIADNEIFEEKNISSNFITTNLFFEN